MKREGVTVHRLGTADIEAWLTMRKAMFSDADDLTHRNEIMNELRKPDHAAFAARSGDLTRLGFIEAGSRSVAEGCETSPVAHVEALWVEGRARRQGIARHLVEAVKSWARDSGFRELGSDTEIGNAASQMVHRRLGFEEVERLVSYRLTL
jgi:aminoglycoside 6'-N-acetyltransferase I